MKKRKLSAFLLLSLSLPIILYSLSGCQEKDPQKEKIAGKWEHSGFVYEFRPDGKLRYNGDVYRYDFPDNDTLLVRRGEETLTLSFEETEEGIKINGVPLFRHVEADKNIFSRVGEMIDRLGRSFSEFSQETRT